MICPIVKLLRISAETNMPNINDSSIRAPVKGSWPKKWRRYIQNIQPTTTKQKSRERNCNDKVPIHNNKNKEKQPKCSTFASARIWKMKKKAATVKDHRKGGKRANKADNKNGAKPRDGLLVLSFLVSCIGIWYAMSWAPAKVLMPSELQEMSQKLRGDDNRLFRPSPTEATAMAQNEVCPNEIPSLVETLHASNLTLRTRGNAAEVLQLCTTNNPRNRAKIGSVNRGKVFMAMKDLMHEGMSTYNTTLPLRIDARKRKALLDGAGKAIAQAAEAVWILSYNNENNQKGFFEAGVVDELIMIIQNCQVSFDKVGPCSEAVMWSLAALQNLAASYCDSPDGHCEWDRTKNSPNLFLPWGVQKVTKIDKVIRQRIMHFWEWQDFGKRVSFFLCAGPVRMPHGDYYSWPGQAKDIDSEIQPQIIPWAAAGLIKSLAIDRKTRSYFGRQIDDNGNLFVCLCDMHKRSPDWLEAETAQSALYRMGWDHQCPDVKDYCEDNGDFWVDAETGKSCLDFENERLCASMGHHVGKDNEMTANEACCICGGGSPVKVDPEVKKEFFRAMEQ
jgi:hypothetical protein